VAQDPTAPKKQKLGSGAPLTRRNSSGSMGAANTKGRDAGGRDEVKNASIPKLIALAKNWEPDNKKHDPKGMIFSEKLDGVRCYWNGEALFTRQGHMICAPDNFTKDFPTDTHLDGELWIDRGKFQEVSGLARTIVSEPRNWKPVRFLIFDAPQIKGGLLARLEAAEKKVAGCKFGRVLEHNVCQGHEHVQTELKRVEDLGGEGLMLRHATAMHRAGRTPDLLKVKTQHDDEAVVEGHEPGKGKHSGLVGALLCKARNGKQFKVKDIITD